MGTWTYRICNALFPTTVATIPQYGVVRRSKHKDSYTRKRHSRRFLSFLPSTVQGWSIMLLSVLLLVYAIDFCSRIQMPGGSSIVPRIHGRFSIGVSSPSRGKRADNLNKFGEEDMPLSGETTSARFAGSITKTASIVPDTQQQVDGEVPSAVSVKVHREAVTSSSDSDTRRRRYKAGAADEGNDPAGEVPMGRRMASLQVPAGGGRLDVSTVKMKYRKLAKAYLAPFSQGIFRHMFFDVLRRRTYALTPPGANKGMQSMMFQIIDKKLYMMDPYEVPKNSKAFYRTRINEIIWILSKLASAGRIKNTEFMVSIHDCVQTVNKPHSYRGAEFEESIPAFTIVSCNFSDNIPFPMWEGEENRGGGFENWDGKMKEYATNRQPWSDKQPQAVFRGGNRPSMFFKNKTDANMHCNEVGRTRLSYLADANPKDLDVSVGGSCGGKHQYLNRMGEKSQQKYKYVVYAEGNCFWADRLNKQVFGPSMIVKQETPCGQFWEPLLTPMTHYVPTDFFFGDLIDKIKWAREHEEKAQEIVRNANEFAANFLSLSGIETYVEVLLDEYTSLLVEPVNKVETGAIEVTNKRV
jgi:Glycosyl transferase family 90